MAESDHHRSFYTHEAGQYEVTRYGSRYGQLFRILQRDAVRRCLPRVNRILDVATGTGQMLPELAVAGKTVVASDLTPEMLREARQRHGGADQIVYCVADASRLPYADCAFEVVASSRFLHLFDPATQAELIMEMARVLKPGGLLLVDFYSSDARRVFWVPVSLYRRVLGKRPENDFRISIRDARDMIEAVGLEIADVQGVGNFLLLLLLWLPASWQVRIATWLGRRFALLSEQFLVAARKP